MSKVAPKFRGKVVKGRFYPFEQETYDIWLSSLEDKIVSLSIKEFKNDRTNKQSAYYWAVIVKLISEDTGYTEDRNSRTIKINVP
jgi:hypothetical protein